MNPEVKQEWIEELRSGKHEQTQGALQRLKPLQGASNPEATKVGKCCLGVLCDIAVKHGVISPITGDPTLSEDRVYYLDEAEDRSGATFANSALLPNQVMKWAGLDSDNGTYQGDDDYTHALTNKNDTGATFDEIADLIEKHF